MSNEKEFNCQQQVLETIHSRSTGDISEQRRMALRRKRKKK